MPRFQKGSPEAQEWAKKMREARMSKSSASGAGVAPAKYRTLPVGAQTFKSSVPPLKQLQQPKQPKKIAGQAVAPPSRLPPTKPRAELSGAGIGCMECDKCCGLGILGGGKRRSGNVEDTTEDMAQMTLEPQPQRRRLHQSNLNNMPLDVFKEVLRMLSYADLMNLLNVGLADEKKSAVERALLYSTPPSSPIQTAPPLPTRRRRAPTMPTSPISFPNFQLEY